MTHYDKFRDMEEVKPSKAPLHSEKVLNRLKSLIKNKKNLQGPYELAAFILTFHQTLDEALTALVEKEKSEK